VERTSVAFTIILLALSPAQAAHPSQKLQTAGTKPTIGKLVGTQPDSRGLSFARQVVEPQAPTADANARGSNRAKTRTIYLNRDGVMLQPGVNDSAADTSSIVTSRTSIPAWDIDEEGWQETVDCMKGMFSRFDVVVTDVEPSASVPHIEAVFAGGGADLIGLDDTVAGISPFATDCSIVETSVVFTFTEATGYYPQLACEIMAQEVAHSYGLDHQLLAEDPMSYLEYVEDRSFQNAVSECGEYDSRPCGIDGSVCSMEQNSVTMLAERLGVKGEANDDGSPNDGSSSSSSSDDSSELGGCSTSSSSTGSASTFGLLLGLAALKRRRNRLAARS
jgi:uncharacterized protein (TIGR03382 family)